jgi:hypothetical protein
MASRLVGAYTESYWEVKMEIPVITGSCWQSELKHVAAGFPLRPARMAVAVTDILVEAVDAYRDEHSREEATKN